MYKHLAGNDLSNITLADQKRNAYGEQGVEISLAKAMEEISANNILYLYNNDEAKFHKAIDRIVNGTNEKAKQGLRKYIDYLNNIIKKIWDLLSGKSAKERAKYQPELDEITRLRDMFESAFAKAVENAKAAQAKQTSDINSTKNLENKTNQEYNENINYALKAQRGRSIELETMENNRFERLREFYDDLPSEWYAFTDKYFYIYSNHSYTDYTILTKVRITATNRQNIITFTEGLENGIDRSTKAFNKWSASFRRGKGRYSWHSVSASKARATGRVNGVDVRPPRSDNARNIEESGKNTEIDKGESLSLKPLSDNDYSNEFIENTVKSFGIQKIGDYIHVQRQVLDTLVKENFFTDIEKRSRVDVNKDSGMIIETNKSGIDETFSFNNFARLGKLKKISKLATIRLLPEIIRDGRVLDDDVKNKYNNGINKTFAYIEHKVEVDGKNVIVKLAIKKSPQKNKFWVHSIYTTENVSNSPASTKDGTEAGHITADIDKTISHSEPKVKSFSLKEKWHPDLTRQQVKMVEGWLQEEGSPEATRITDTANWYMGRISGQDLFVIYSNEDAKGSTILYESKGKQAKLEKDILMDLLEEIENGKSANGKSAYVNWVFSGGWMRQRNSIRHNISRLGSGQNNQNAGVLPGQPQGNPSAAFENVIRNIFKIQERHGNKEHSLKGTVVEGELAGLVNKYGAIPKGENPARDIDVPRKTAGGKKVSHTVRTILEAKATPDEALPSISELVTKGEFSYDTYTDKEAIAEAEEDVTKKGWEQAKADWYKTVGKGEVSKRNTALGWAIYNNAVNSGEMETALEVLGFMVKHQRSAAQALQATRILKTLSPETQLYGVQKSVISLQEELTNKYGKKAPDLKISEELAEKFLNAKTEDERLAAEIELYKDIGRQMPSDWLDKWNAWRYTVMLTSLRTHGRNILGNAGFAPVVMMKNLTATAIESVVHRVSGKKMVRGKALVWGSKADKALLKAAWDKNKVGSMSSTDKGESFYFHPLLYSFIKSRISSSAVFISAKNSDEGIRIAP